jgi:hypothetical protein
VEAPEPPRRSRACTAAPDPASKHNIGWSASPFLYVRSPTSRRLERLKMYVESKSKVTSPTPAATYARRTTVASALSSWRIRR